MFAGLFCAGMILALAWATVRGKDAWPFSHYPMFSELAQVKDIVVFRLALETHEGEIIWWRSHFYRYPEQLGRILYKLDRLEREAKQPPFFSSLGRQRYLGEVLRLIALEEGSSQKYRAFHIVRRTASQDGNHGVVIHDTRLSRIPIAALQRARHAQ